ncbi:type II secretion system protein E [Acetobacter orientalis]|uniref:Type II secretion system protein E n=1 Tax=Acetobacter orientalis TaxID=146474 RepID=A0A2Z5ZHB2_9PROT|nr:type II secretion system protein E [Acetobacter orientalis]
MGTSVTRGLTLSGRASHALFTQCLLPGSAQKQAPPPHSWCKFGG